MPDVYGPFDGATWQQSQWYRDAYARELSGVAGSTFTASTAGDLALTVSGLTITMGLGRAHVRGAGYERTGTAWSYDVPANTNATNARRDRLVLRRDLAAKTVLPAVLQGTPAATPTAPALTQNEDAVWELPLFSWTTPANSGAPLTAVTDERVPGDLGALRRNVLWPVLDQNSGIVTDIAAGWSLTSLYLRRAGLGMCYLDSTWTRTGAAITVPADGNIPNQTLGTLVQAYRPPLNVQMSANATGAMTAGTLAAGGQINLQSVAPGTSLGTNAIIQLSTSFYPLADVNVAAF